MWYVCFQCAQRLEASMDQVIRDVNVALDDGTATEMAGSLRRTVDTMFSLRQRLHKLLPAAFIPPLHIEPAITDNNLADLRDDRKQSRRQEWGRLNK